MKYQAINTIKMITGAMLAILVSNALGLDFALSSGVIAMISLLQTKKESIVTGMKRLFSAIVGVVLAGGLFYLVGFDLWVLALFLLLYIPVTILMKLESVMITSIVLVSHIYSDGMLTLPGILNEVYLMMIGIGIAIVMNLYMPNYESEIKKIQQETEKLMVELLSWMANQILEVRDEKEQILKIKELKQSIKTGQDLAYQYMNNRLLEDNSYYADYFSMRKAQYRRLNDMVKYLGHHIVTIEEANDVKRFILKIADEFHESNTGQALLDELASIREKYKSYPLPESREAFENRAMLYQFLNDIENFIEIKADFVVMDSRQVV